MKRIYILCLFTISTFYGFAQSAAISTDGSNAHGSAMLEVKSSNKGMLVPRMTTAQRTAIASPAKGLLVFDNDTGDFWFYNGTAWTSLTSGEPTNQWKKNTDTIFTDSKISVGIGTTSPIKGKFHVAGTAKTLGYFASENSRGVSIQQELPTIGFNQFYESATNSSRYMGNGFAANIYLDPSNGYWYFNQFPTGLSNNTTGANKIAMTIAGNGYVGINGQTPLTSLQVFGATSLNRTTVTIGSGSTINVGNRSYFFVKCTTPFGAATKLSDGLVVGQLLILESGVPEPGELIYPFSVKDDPANTNMDLAADYSMSSGNVLTLIWNGTSWLQISYSNN